MPEVVGWGGGGGFMLVEWTMRDLTGSSEADFDLQYRKTEIQVRWTER